VVKEATEITQLAVLVELSALRTYFLEVSIYVLFLRYIVVIHTQLLVVLHLTFYE
jgi:hypothetical protein